MSDDHGDGGPGPPSAIDAGPDTDAAATSGASDGATEPGPAMQPALLQLHAALTDLDRALSAARRALNAALDRPPPGEPSSGLPYRELRRLAEQLGSLGTRRADVRGAKIRDLLDELEPAEDADSETSETGAVAGVAPSGKLRLD